MERVALDEWQVVAAIDSLPPGQEVSTRLLGTDLSLMRPAGTIVAAWPAASGKALPVCVRHGHVWTTLGSPAQPLFDLPRPLTAAVSIPVDVPPHRVLDAFLDEDAEAPHPYCVVRHQPAAGLAGLFVQPVEDGRCIVHLLARDAASVAAAQLEFAQLKPILENQTPQCRPLSGISAWYPVASSGDLVPRHIFHTALAGQELALWRDDSGLANVWENRCPHRGVRLTIGANLGTGLRCRYHGWQFASGSGQCTTLSAQVRTYPCVERHGLVWTSLAGAPEDIPDVGATSWQPVRAVFVEAPMAVIAAELPEQDGLKLFLQPVSETQTVIHGLSGDPAISLRRHDEVLTRLRDRIEAGAA
jgi:nitrite reductase/ring-hydroxylating ferredoxin subunit